MTPLLARALNAHIITQVRANLPRWPQSDGRFLTELMLATGRQYGARCQSTAPTSTPTTWNGGGRS
jgi:hypothetical protein